MLSKFKRNKHQQHLAQLPKLSQSVDDVEFFYAPAEFREALLTRIAHATQRICIIALYLEQDDGGKGILQALYDAKRQRPELDVRVLVDWHRAQRGRIGAAASNTNADWYCRMANENRVDIPFTACRLTPGRRSAFSISKALLLMTASSTAAPA